MINIFRKSDVLIGVDVGAFGIKIAKLKKNGNTFNINGLFIETFNPLEETTEGLITAKLKSICNHNGIKGKVNVSVNIADVLVRDIKVPVVPDNELPQIVAWEAKKIVDITPETHNIDFFIHNKGEVEQGGKYKGLFVAAKKEFLSKRVKSIENAGLNVKTLGLEVDAYRALFPFNKSIEINIPTAVVDIGFSSTTISIFHKNKLLFTRELNVSTKKIITKIIENLNVEFNEAMKRLLNVDLNNKDDYNSIEHIVLSELDTVTSELNRSFNFFTSVAQKGMVDRVFVTGGLAQIKGINQFMLQKLGIITKTFNPTSGLQLNCKTQGIYDQYSVAIGMALIK